MKRFFAVITALSVITFSGCMELFDKNDSSASYTVECYRQNADNPGYALQPEETSVQGGIAGRMTGVIAKPLTGFTAKTVSQKKIRSDGSTIVKLYYDRKIVTLTFNSDGGSSVASISGKYGAAVPTVPAPAKSGYTFGGWTPAIPTEFPAVDTAYTAQWAAESGTMYKIEHYQESAAGGSYTIIDSESKTGTTGTNAAFTPKTYAGFTQNTAKTNINGTVQAAGAINADGSTVVKLYYDRKTVTFTFNTDGGSSVASISGKYGAAVPMVPAPAKSGYTFGGWMPAIPTEFPAVDTAYTAQWAAGNGTMYKIEHYQESAAGGSYTISDTESKTGTTGTNAVYNPKTYAGFTQNTAKTNINGRVQAAGAINADGTTIVKLYYDRKTVTLTFNTDGGSSVASISGKYGAAVPTVPAPAKSGYTFGGWMPAIPTEFPAVDTAYTAQWAAGNGTMYKIEHYQESAAGGSYTISDTESKTGTTGTNAVYNPKTYAGFTQNTVKTNINGTVQAAGAINADGSTVVKLYYDRKTVTLTFNSDGGSSVASISGKYGAVVPTVPEPAKSGYTFGGWTPAIPTEFPADNATYTAKWKTAAYKITGLIYSPAFGGYDNRYAVTPPAYLSQIESVWFNGELGNKKGHKSAIGAAGQNKDLKAYCIDGFLYFHKELEEGTIVELKDADGNVLGSFTYVSQGVDFTQNN